MEGFKDVALVLNDREVLASSWCIAKHSVFFRHMLEATRPKRTADGMMRITVTQPHAPEDFEAAIDLMHVDTWSSMVPSKLERILHVLDFLNAMPPPLSVTILPSSSDDEKLSYLRICTMHSQYSTVNNIYTCVDRNDRPLIRWLPFLDQAMDILRPWFDGDENGYVEKRVWANLIGTSANPTFWTTAIPTPVLSDDDEANPPHAPLPHVPAIRMEVLTKAFPFAVCAYHARKSGYDLPPCTSMDFAQDLAHMLVNARSPVLSIGGIAALGDVSGIGTFGVLAVPIFTPTGNNTLCARLSVMDTPVVLTRRGEGGIRFSMRKEVRDHATVYVYTTVDDKLRRFYHSDELAQLRSEEPSDFVVVMFTVRDL